MICRDHGVGYEGVHGLGCGCKGTNSVDREIGVDYDLCMSDDMPRFTADEITWNINWWANLSEDERHTAINAVQKLSDVQKHPNTDIKRADPELEALLEEEELLSRQVRDHGEQSGWLTNSPRRVVSSRPRRLTGRNDMGFKLVQHFTYDGREADLEVESQGYGQGVTLKVKFLQEVVDTEQRVVVDITRGGSPTGDDEAQDVELVTGRRKEGRTIEMEWDKEQLQAFIRALEVFA